MDSYEITRIRKCEPTAAGHEHVITVEINGEPQPADRIYVLARQGEDIYTTSPSTGKTAAVEPWPCCGLHTLRSHIDAVTDNNLDNLPPL